MVEGDEFRKAEIIKSLESSKEGELLQTIANMFLELVPGGGAISELINYSLKDMKQRRLVNFVVALKMDLEETKAQLPDMKNYIRSEDFAFLLEATLRGVSRNYQQEKLDAYRGLFVNSIIRQDVGSEQKEYFFSLIDRLTVSHIIFLKVLSDPLRWAEEQGLNYKQPAGANGPTPLTNFRLLLPKYEEAQVRAIIGDLYYFGIITLRPDLLNDVLGSDLGAMTDKLTSMGNLFLRFVRVRPIG